MFKRHLLTNYINVMVSGHFMMMSDIDGNFDGTHSQINLLCLGKTYCMTVVVNGETVICKHMKKNEILELNLNDYHKWQFQSIHGMDAYTFEKGTDKLVWQSNPGELNNNFVETANKIIFNM